MTALASGLTFANRVAMQNRLFAELSSMFGREVPLYDKALEVNRVCNTTVCALLSTIYPNFAITPAQFAHVSGERHGAIRIGRADEYRWVGRLFACFAMEPHNFYDMTDVGARSQPVIATAFRSRARPEHRVFTSLLMTDLFDPVTRARIEALLASRQVFSPRAKELIEKCEIDGGLSEADGEALIHECTERIFKWTASARDHALYCALSDAGFKLAADISCFESHHLNHLTPNTLCMDLYTAAMEYCLGDVDGAWLRERADSVLRRLALTADRHYMALHFREGHEETLAAPVAAATPRVLSTDARAELVERFVAELARDEFRLSELNHSGFKDCTEGPCAELPILLRQDAYKALTEPVCFVESDGSIVPSTHTARFGEIEERGYACTPVGMALYDACLVEAERVREADPSLAARDLDAYEAAYARPFSVFPVHLDELLAKGLVYGLYRATAEGVAAAARATFATTDLLALARLGFVEFEGQRYEDFLPVSAAGIFASNLNQYGTPMDALVKPVYSKAQLESVLGRRIIDINISYAGMEAESKLATYRALGLFERVTLHERTLLERAVDAWKRDSAVGF